jgi:predicted P-loop ATPase/GTPase
MYKYEVEYDGTTIIYTSNCEPHEFGLAVEFVGKLDDYNEEVLEKVIKAIDRSISRVEHKVDKSFVL